MARIALKNEGSIKGAVDKLARGGGIVNPVEDVVRERSKLREKLRHYANGNWVVVGYCKTLIGMSYTKMVATAALRQENNSLNTALQWRCCRRSPSCHGNKALRQKFTVFNILSCSGDKCKLLSCHSSNCSKPRV